MDASDLRIEIHPTFLPTTVRCLRLLLLGGQVGALVRKGRLQMDAPAVDACSLGKKELPKRGLHVASIRESIEIELQTAQRLQS